MSPLEDKRRPRRRAASSDELWIRPGAGSVRWRTEAAVNGNALDFWSLIVAVLIFGEGIRPEIARALRDIALAQPGVRDVGRVLSM